MLTYQEAFALSSASTLRPPDWRWTLARVLRNQPRASADLPQHPDPAVNRAIVVQSAFNSDDEVYKTKTARAVRPAEADAYIFHHRGAVAREMPETKNEDYPEYGTLTPDSLASVELEALILAGKKASTIAKVVGLSEDSVNLYEQWWFDVRSRLPHKGWIAHRVLGSLHQGSPQQLLPALIRAYGYYTKSARIVSTVASTFDASRARLSARDPGQFFAADAVVAGGLKAALAVRLMPLTRRTYARVMELHHAAMDLHIKDKAASGDTEDSTLYKDAMEQLFNNVNFGPPPLELHAVRLADDHQTA